MPAKRRKPYRHPKYWVDKITAEIMKDKLNDLVLLHHVAVEDMRDLMRYLVFSGGGECPVCHQNAQAWEHRLRSPHVRFLMEMYDSYGLGPWKLDVECRRIFLGKAFQTSGTEVARSLGLITHAEIVFKCEDFQGCKGTVDDPCKKKDDHRWDRGVYRITPYGEQFLTGAQESWPAVIFYSKRRVSTRTDYAVTAKGLIRDDYPGHGAFGEES